MQQKAERGEILRMTAEVVAAYVGNNSLPATQLWHLCLPGPLPSWFLLNAVAGSAFSQAVQMCSPPSAAVPPCACLEAAAARSASLAG